MPPHTVKEFLIYDSFSFTDEVSSFCTDHFMASLDTESLLINIHLNEINDICIYDLCCNTNIYHNFDRNDIRELLPLAYELFFIFDQVMYRQIDGVQWVFHWI